MKNSKNELNVKNSKGITLIALVVTIIVLIILAGVSINLVLGENGIITKAKEAKTETEQATLNEQVALNEIVEYMENNGATSNPPVEYAPYDNPYIPAGFTHIGTEDWNSGYQIQETSTGNVFVWVPCVLDQSKVKEGDNVQTFKKTLPSTTATTDPYYMYNKDNYTITGDESPANLIKTSVGTYGGFYIAAYEAGVPLAGDGTTEIASTSATTSQKARSVAGATAWTNITRTNAITAASNMITTTTDGVKSGLISGECWDTTLQWMVNSSTNAAANVGYDTNSTGNGYYGQTAKATTGQYPINNIYDMAGNVWEWTTENCTLDGYLGFRGGGYDLSGSVYPAAFRIFGGDNAADEIAFRVVLYKYL